MQLENVLHEIERFDSLIQIENFLERISATPTYLWAGVALFPEGRVLGRTPNSIENLISDECFKTKYTQQIKPSFIANIAVGTSLESSLNDILVIPVRQCIQRTGVLFLGLSELPNMTTFIEKLSWYWQLVSIHLFDAINRCLFTPGFGLTSREKECLHWASAGKTSWEISKILHISERTVNFHIANTIKKTDSVSRQQAIYKYCLTL